MPPLDASVLSELSNLSAAAAVIVITGMFLWFIDKQSKNLEARSKAASDDFEKDLSRVVEGAQELNKSLSDANIRLVDVVDRKLDAVVQRTDQIIHQSTKIEEMLTIRLEKELRNND